VVSDLITAEKAFGITIPIQINDDNGDPDDLTVYSAVRFVVSAIDYSSNILNHTVADAELSLGAIGILNWSPTSANKTPVFGKYWIQVFREAGNVNKPIKKFTYETTREATKV